jgi:hypothetical protein
MKIIHAIGMVAGCALGLVAYRGLTPRLNSSYRAFGQVYDLVMAVAVGLILTGGLTIIFRRWRGDARALSRPGHWLLEFGLAAVAASIGAIAAYYGWYLAAGVPVDVNSRPYWVPFDLAFAPHFPGMCHQAVGWGFGAVFALVFSMTTFRRLRWHWWAFFVVIAAAASLLSAGHAAALAQLWGRAGALSWCAHAAQFYALLIAGCSFLIVVAVARDVSEGHRGDTRDAPRDALHWVGVSVWLLIGAAQLVLYARYTGGSIPLTWYVQYLKILFTP